MISYYSLVSTALLQSLAFPSKAGPHAGNVEGGLGSQ
jgi:hypothetical protein